MKEKATLIFVVCGMTILASRLRTGHKEWDPTSEFFMCDDRNMTGSSLFHDEKGVLHHVNGMGRKGVEGWADLAMLHRYSRDSGITWSVAHPISTCANDQQRHQVIASIKRIGHGALIQPCDATPGGNIRGIHADIVELHDGRWGALVRGNNIESRMPMSISYDEGRTWPHVKLITPGGITALFRPAPLRKGLDMMSNAASRPISVNKNF